jgi:nitrogenase molybdenum-iron protein alpha/beta subunit
MNHPIATDYELKSSSNINDNQPLSDFKHINADAFSGALWALDGVRNGVVILNGPTGCKFYHASISNGQLCRGTSYNPAQIGEEFYFRQNRIPCTYLDGNDFVYGSEEKLKKALDEIAGDQHGFIAVVNSPGAALIGDNLDGIILKYLKKHIPFVSIENSGFSEAYNIGFEKASIALLEALKLKVQPKVKKRINLLGFSIYQKHYEGNLSELKRLLKLVGIEVGCTLMAGCTTQQLQASASAELQVLLAPEYGRETAQWYQNHFDMPTLQLPQPIGFDATQLWIEQICALVGVSPDIAIQDINRGRAISFRYLEAFNSLSGFPKGASYAIKADLSEATGLFQFLTPYLGMLPAVIELTDNKEVDSLHDLEQLLSAQGFNDLLKDITLEDYHMQFADGNTIAQEKAQNKTFTGVEIALPTLGYTDVIPKAIMGTQGALYLIEQIINGLKFFCK